MRTLPSVITFCAVLLAAAHASAGVYIQDLSQCVAKVITEDDKAALMQWMFSAISVSPAVKGLSTVTPQQRLAFSKKGAETVDRLLLTNCRAATLDALKYEGPAAFGESVQMLGEVAARGLMTSPGTTTEIQLLTNRLDRDKWAAIAKEAGLPVGPGTDSDP